MIAALVGRVRLDSGPGTASEPVASQGAHGIAVTADAIYLAYFSGVGRVVRVPK